MAPYADGRSDHLLDPTLIGDGTGRTRGGGSARAPLWERSQTV